VESAAERVRSEFGGLNGLVHSAAAHAPTGLIDTPLSVWEEIIHTNLTGTFIVCKAFMPLLLAHSDGSVVLLSSVTSQLGGRSPQYAASKAGVEGLMRSLAREVSPQGVRVNAVAPGGTDTGFAERYWSPDTRSGVISNSLLGRVAHPAEIATAIVFLLSTDSSYVTGTTVHVNGGLYLT